MKSKSELLLENTYELILEGAFETAGHALLDIAGLIPGVGEAADVANAIWYCAKKQYLEAALSLISCIPVIGDVVGKGTKLGMFLSKVGPKIVNAKKIIAANKNLVESVLKKASEHEKLAPHIPEIKKALNAFMGSKAHFE